MRKIYLIAFAVLLAATINHAAAQETSAADDKEPYNQFYVGFGAGFDYGGVGLKAEFLPAKWLGVFVGGGYNFVDPAFNTGVSVKVLPDKRVTPVVMAMYGYNAALKIKSAMGGPDFFRKSYYGVSTGVGAEVKNGDNKLSFVLMVPFRNSTFHNDYDGFKEDGVEFNPDILPIGISVGYNFVIGKKKR